MQNETMRAKLVELGNVLVDLTRVVITLAEEYGPVVAVPKEFTIEEVREALSSVERERARGALKAVGARRLSEVRPEDYGKLMAALSGGGVVA